ncbi:MAG: SsrA-binding protein SmpB [Actinomycetota bacterium]
MAVAKSKAPARSGTKLIAQNRKARHNYEIEDIVEAGIVLVGTEVKSCREGRVNMSEAYATIDGNGEAWLLQCHISPYSHGNVNNHEPVRPRKLLLRADEIERLAIKVNREGRTLIPLRMYFKHGLVKVELAVGRGKRLYDKRQDQARRDADRSMQRQLGRRR